jgi:hypothetical protein
MGCVSVEADAMRVAARMEYQRWFAEVVREDEEREGRWRRELQEVAEKHKLTVQEVRETVRAHGDRGARPVRRNGWLGTSAAAVASVRPETWARASDSAL